MKGDDAKICSVCGAPLPAASHSCPACLLQTGLKPEAEPGVSSSERALDEQTQPELEGQRFENYEIVNGEDGTPIELGRGAMGVTYKAIDLDLQCVVTLKVIGARYLNDETARRRFLREARVTASVRHPNVASVFHLGKSGENYFYAMEFVEGETLKSLIQRSGRLPVKLALEITAQVAAGLVAVHERKLVHRDIKPTNIMVSLKDENRITAKIIDLGLSKSVAELSSEPEISTPGAFAGTPEFASPEQFAGVGVDIRSDLYSLGVTLWEMLTGKAPFRGTLAEVMYQHQHTSLPLEQLIDMPQPLVVLLQILLEKDSKLRFQNPTELGNALPKVNEAIKAGRSIIDQNLRILTDEQLRARSKATSVLVRLKTAIGSRKGPLFLRAALALLATGGVITMVSIFFPASHRIKDTSIPTLRETKMTEKSIAVLPFESLSDNKSDTYFADGVQDEILSNLAKVSQLRVISRTSVMTFRPNGNRDLRSIAAVLNVAHVLEGTVRRDGNRVRITTELVDAQTDQALWSDSYDRDLTDIFAIQSEIAQTVVSKLSARLSSEEKQGMHVKPTANLEAYEIYLQAKDLIRGPSLRIDSLENGEHFLNAIALLERATRMDPTFALAYCQIAKADDWLYSWNLDATPKRRMHGDAAVNEALRLDPNIPETQLAAAFHLYRCYRDYQKAKLHIAIAGRTSPNSADALVLTGFIDREQGHWEESTKALERACDLDPRNPEPLFQLAQNYLCLARYREMEQSCDRLIALEPENPDFKFLKASIPLSERADLRAWRSAVETLPSSMKNIEETFSSRIFVLIYSREWTKAKELVRSTSNEELPFAGGPMVPRLCLAIAIAKYQGEHPETNPEFAATRDQLFRKVEAHPEDPYILSALGQMDAYLGRKQNAIQEAQHAVDMLPVSKNAYDGPEILKNLAIVYALTNEPDLAFQALDIAVKTPGPLSYGELKLDPDFDPLRKDPRFGDLLTRLAPHE
jgi:serine/threonine protein kinase/tetratricopeptide (TPR) repeat protein